MHNTWFLLIEQHPKAEDTILTRSGHSNNRMACYPRNTKCRLGSVRTIHRPTYMYLCNIVCTAIIMRGSSLFSRLAWQAPRHSELVRCIL